ncbi:uncharacterized protein LOC131952787 [Physella acuta]|uniref:uncharacterized protein LOC131952787 n=1 Tax=Physella acuta TaxID=109671 RepID=UPI0027DD3FE7|nr:uncharacterized protein LOC131952787 [Physella acuta]
MFDDFSRARRRLTRSYLYWGWAISRRFAQDKTRARMSARRTEDCGGHIGHFSGPLMLLRNRITSRCKNEAGRSTADAPGCGYNLLEECMNASLLGLRPGNLCRSWVRDIVNILKDAELIDHFFRVITSRALAGASSTSRVSTDNCSVTQGSDSVSVDKTLDVSCVDVTLGDMSADQVLGDMTSADRLLGDMSSADQLLVDRLSADPSLGNRNYEISDKLDNNLNDRSSAGPPYDDMRSDITDKLDDSCIDEDLLSFSFEEDYSEACEEENRSWAHDTWYSDDVFSTQHSHVDWSFQPELLEDRLDPEDAPSPWSVGTQANHYLIDNSDLINCHLSPSDHYKCKHISCHDQCLAPCMNHSSPFENSCLYSCDNNTHMFSASGDTDVHHDTPNLYCDVENTSIYPDVINKNLYSSLDEMMPMCTGRSSNSPDLETGFPDVTEMNDDFDACINDIDPIGESCMRCEHNCIDTMKDTYTLTTFSGDKKLYLHADDGARGDGIHFNLGLHPAWWTQGDATHPRSSFSALSDPSPQDRLARITYKTQPSSASSADAPMFVFSSAVGSVNRNGSSSRAIPLDFNLNAVYKIATREERGAGDTKSNPDADNTFDACKHNPPEGAHDVAEWLRPQEEESSASGTRTSTPTEERELKGNRNINSVGSCREAPSRSTDSPSRSRRWFKVSSVCVLVTSIISIHYWNSDSFFSLVWDMLLHTTLVALLMLLVFVCLEANNLTESFVARLQLFIKSAISSPYKVKSAEDTHADSEKLPDSPKTGSSIVPESSCKLIELPEVPRDTPDVEDQKGVAESPESGLEEVKQVPELDRTSTSPKAMNPSEVFEIPVHVSTSGSLNVCREFMFSSESDAVNEVSTESRSSVQDSLTSEDTRIVSNSQTTEPSRIVFNSEEVQAGDQKCMLVSDDIVPCQSSKVTFRAEIATMTEMTQDCDASLAPHECSVAQTMTEHISFESSATQTEHTIVDDRAEGAVQIVEIWPEAANVVTANASVQAELDAKKVYQQTEKLQQKHQLALKRLQKKFLAIRRHCQKEALELKQCERRKNEFLSKLQLSLPNLQKEKSSLMAERASIDKQFEDEKKKNRELVGRLTRLNQQFYRLGQVQQPTPAQHWRQQYQQTTYPLPVSRPHCEATNQLAHSKLIHIPAPQQQQQQPLHQKIQQQSTLLQNQARSNNSLPTTGQQQKQQQQKQQQQTILQQLHQQRLPIFQLFNKSFCQPHHDVQLQQLQQSHCQHHDVQQLQQSQLTHAQQLHQSLGQQMQHPLAQVQLHTLPHNQQQAPALSHLQQQSQTICQQPQAIPHSQQQPQAMPSGQQQPQAMSHGHQQPQAMSHQLQAISHGQQQSLTQHSKLQM